MQTIDRAEEEWTLMKTVRRIIKIDEEKCNGCGLCIPNCPEEALQIINGKAKLIHEIYCDGLGACINTCPQGAIVFDEREAEKFDEDAVKQRSREMSTPGTHVHEHTLAQQRTPVEADQPTNRIHSTLKHWPVQLTLVHPRAPFFEGSDLLVVADCVPFAYADFHRDFLRGKSIVIGCPKLDDTQSYEKKLTELFRQSSIRSVTVINMEVPCCYGLHLLVHKALQSSGKNIPLEQVIIGTKGERKN